MASPAKTSHLQDTPRLGNQYLEDTALRQLLQRVVPKNVLNGFEKDLVRFGDLMVGEPLAWGREVDRNPPVLVQVDAFGHRVDEVRTNPCWKKLQDFSAEEGLIAIGYERKFQEWSRIYQFVKLYLFGPSSGLFTCPLAMTDGAARLIELWGKKEFGSSYQHLTSRDPNQFWTSGQWMTERIGGSDVGNSETVAEADPKNPGKYLLTGYKFFTSSSTSEMAVTLARIVGDSSHPTIPGSRGLSAFYVETKKGKELNGLTLHKLKNKLGTKAVPTAEMELNKTEGQLLGKPGKGVVVISTILNITRIHNATASVGAMRRCIAVARDYCHRRKVFGKLLKDQALHLNTLADLEVHFRAALQMWLQVLVWFGKSELGTASKDEEILLRISTPLLKLFTAKQSVYVVSECIESLGGVGYMEDSDMPRYLRDTQVTPIWEGTTNVLSLDIWRPIVSNGALIVFEKEITRKLDQVVHESLSASKKVVIASLAEIVAFIEKRLVGAEKAALESVSRNVAFSLSKIFNAALLLEHAQVTQASVDMEVANRWVTMSCLEQQYLPTSASVNLFMKNAAVDILDAEYLKKSKEIALDFDAATAKFGGSGDVDGRGQLRAKF